MNISIDLKYAVRTLLKKPLFTLVSIAIVAFGLALTLYCYTFLMQLVFKPLTLGNDDGAIIAIESAFDSNHNERRGVDAIDYFRLDNESTVIDEMGIYAESTALIASLDNDSQTHKINSTLIEWDMFNFARVQPIHGRALRADDHFVGAEPVIVLSYDIFHSLFDGNPEIIDQMVMLSAVPTKVVGVMPQHFSFPAYAQSWQPLEQKYLTPTSRNNDSLYAYARLKAGQTIKQLRSELAVFNHQIKTELPEDMQWRINSNGQYLSAENYRKANVHVITYYNFFVSMFAMVIFVLLLTCINIGNLLLTRVNEKYKEVAIKLALGIPNRRLLLQMLLESIFICTVGGVLALCLTLAGLHLTNHFFVDLFAVNGYQPFWWKLSLELDGLLVLLLTIALTIGLTGLLPAWQAIHTDFNKVLRDGTRGAMGKGASRVSRILVVSEIALSCAVMIMAITIMGTSYRASQADYGVSTEQRFVAQIEIPSQAYPIRYDHVDEQEDRKQRSKVLYRLKEELEAMPNIQATSFMTSLPGTGEGSSFFEIEGRAAMVYNENPRANLESVLRDSWRAVDMQLLAGRDLDHRDTETRMGNVIINQSIANDYFPDGDAVGSRIRRVWSSGNREWQTIIGVVSDTYHGSTMSTSSERYTMYRSMDTDGRQHVNLAIHYSGTQKIAEQTLQTAISNVDPRLGAYHVRSYQNLIEQPMQLVNAVISIFMLAGMIALLLAGTGIYAIFANSIVQKTQEIGVRMALGSPDSKIYRLFLTQAILQLLVGLSIGVATAFWGLELIADAMNIDNTSYILSFALIPMLISVIVLVATLVPTKNAVSITPANALHYN